MPFQPPRLRVVTSGMEVVDDRRPIPLEAKPGMAFAPIVGEEMSMAESGVA